MTARQIAKRITALGGYEVRQRGSHRRFEATDGQVTVQTTVPDHGGRDLGPGDRAPTRASLRKGMVATVTTYDVTVWREPTGDWSARADGADGALTAGSSLSEVERNIRESIAISLDLPRSAEASMEIRLTVSVDSHIDALVGEARAARDVAARAPELSARAIRELRQRGLSVRDVAHVLGLSAQRVHQLSQRVA